MVQSGNFKLLTLQDPQNPKMASQGPDRAPERQKGLYHLSPVHTWFFVEKKENTFWRGDFFLFHLSWPNDKDGEHNKNICGKAKTFPVVRTESIEVLLIYIDYVRGQQ